MALALSPHPLIDRVRARFRASRALPSFSHRGLWKGVLFAAFVVAVCVVGRAWALVRPSPVHPPSAAPLAAAAPFAPAAPDVPSSPDASVPMAFAHVGTGAGAPSGVAPAFGPMGEQHGSGGGVVDLNTAGASDLETLPHVGPKRAQAILALRTKLGRFKSVDELLKVKGIGRATLKRMRPRLTLSPP